MVPMASEPLPNPALPELVRDSELKATATDGDYTVHPQPFSRRSKGRGNTWVREKNLGRGGYGEVWLERKVDGDNSLPRLRAVKSIRVPEAKTIFELNGGRCIRELEALAKFSQDNFKEFFVKSYGWYTTPGSLNIAMEYCSHGDLKGYLERVKTIPPHEVRDIALQILGALASMHGNGFAHRDLKPANILIKTKPPQDWWVKLADFGLSKRHEGTVEASTIRGTPSFMAPETLGFPFTGEPKKASPYSADMWCFGETLFRCLTGHATFEDKQQLYEYQHGKQPFPIEKLLRVKASGFAIHFIHFLMQPLPSQRLDTEQAAHHLWLSAEQSGIPSSISDAPRPPQHRRSLDRFVAPARIQSSYLQAYKDNQLTEASGQWSTTETTVYTGAGSNRRSTENIPEPPELSLLALDGSRYAAQSAPTIYHDAYSRALTPIPDYPAYPLIDPPIHDSNAVRDQASHATRGASWRPSQVAEETGPPRQTTPATKDESVKPKTDSRHRKKKPPTVVHTPRPLESSQRPSPQLRPSLPNLRHQTSTTSNFNTSARQTRDRPERQQTHPSRSRVNSSLPPSNFVRHDQGYDPPRPRTPVPLAAGTTSSLPLRLSEPFGAYRDTIARSGVTRRGRELSYNSPEEYLKPYSPPQPQPLAQVSATKDKPRRNQDQSLDESRYRHPNGTLRVDRGPPFDGYYPRGDIIRHPDQRLDESRYYHPPYEPYQELQQRRTPGMKSTATQDKNGVYITKNGFTTTARPGRLRRTQSHYGYSPPPLSLPQPIPTGYPATKDEKDEESESEAPMTAEYYGHDELTSRMQIVHSLPDMSPNQTSFRERIIK